MPEKTSRYIAKCKPCNTAMSTEASSDPNRIEYRWNLERKGLPLGVYEDVEVGSLEPDERTGALSLRCFSCGRTRPAKRVLGRLNRDIKCTAKCLAATGQDCECSCAGKNHGAKFSVDYLARPNGRPGGLAEQFQERIEDLLEEPQINQQKARELAAWLREHYRFNVSMTPRGGKVYKQALEDLYWFLERSPGRHAIEDRWAMLLANLDEVTRLFTDEGGRSVPRELRLGSNTYINEVGFNEARLLQYAKNLEAVFDELKGWRRKALAHGVVVVLAGAESFRRSGVAGTYLSEQDQLLVKATPAVLRRTRGTYGAFDYVMVHELGHRYQRKYRPRMDFDRSEWKTTQYSFHEGEAFAELFAVTNFGIDVPGKEHVLQRFDDLMSSGEVAESEFRKLPEHLRQLAEKMTVTVR